MRTVLFLGFSVAFGFVSTLFMPNPGLAATFVMEKQNTDFAVDGNGGAIQGQQIYLWNTNLDNLNQNWVQLNRGGGYYSYRKENTNLCLDGGNGAARGQPVILWPCSTNNQNQHWRKVKVFNGTEIYRMEKRNAPGFSIDGGGRGSRPPATDFLGYKKSHRKKQRDIFYNKNPPPTNG
ncbi:MAG: RICIN domain-containing protein, partial [Myxococcota bacterium]